MIILETTGEEQGRFAVAVKDFKIKSIYPSGYLKSGAGEMNIAGKKIIVTGAASGIGRELVVKLAEIDCEVAAVDRNLPLLLEVCAELREKQARVQPFECELSDPAQVDQLFKQVLQDFGAVDILIANAGFPYYEIIAEPDWGHIARIFEVNVFSPIYAAEKMKALYPNGGYKIAFTVSAMAKFGLPGYALYGASKAALDRFAEVYRFELPDQSSLMLTYPIATLTGFFDEASEKTAPVPWPSQSSELVATAILAGIRADRKTVFPSKLFWLVWRLGAVIPGLYRLEQQIELVRLRKWLAE
jgi:short-subunit dehydrogenase